MRSEKAGDDEDENYRGVDDVACDLHILLGICTAGGTAGAGDMDLHLGALCLQLCESPPAVFGVVFLVDEGTGMVLFVDAVVIDDVARCVDAAGTGQLVEAAAAGTESVLIIVIAFLAFVAAYTGHKPTPFFCNSIAYMGENEKRVTLTMARLVEYTQKK